MRFGGANQKTLWLGYAQSGMGVNAFARARTTSIRFAGFVRPVGTSPATIKFVATKRTTIR